MNELLSGNATTANLDSTYTYNNEGRITATTYPTTDDEGASSCGIPLGLGTYPGPAYNYSYDSMYRLSGMTQTTPATTIVSNVSYNAANQLLTMNYPAYEETRSYNTLGQLTNLNVDNYLYQPTETLTYNYPSGTNNGKVSSMLNSVSGETTTYTYDSLNRLFTASGSGWGQQYGFDGFGNLESKTVTSGSGPSMSLTVNPANNRIEGVSGYTYDANGNMSLGTGTLAYDVENRISYAYAGPTSEAYYAYDSQNRRVFSWPGAEDSLGNATGYTVNMYSPTGQKLGAYVFVPGVGPGNLPYIGITLVSSDQYFGSRRIAVLDQLGSAGTYYPWGEDRGTTNPQDTWSFATYWTDSVSGLDYANNRYYFNSLGRFMTPDPFLSSGDAMSPQSWNRYAYAVGDPVNRNDPSGLDVDCGMIDGQFVCIDDTWGEVTGDASAPTPFGWGSWGPTFSQWFNSLFHVSKSYHDLQDCSFSASQVISYISSNFGHFANFSTSGALNESVTFNPPSGPLTVGENIPITVQIGGSTSNISVTVASVTSDNITFNTTPGHLLYPGTISFTATELANGSFTFSIILAGQLGSPGMATAFFLGGGSFENAEWNNFLNQIGLLCNQPPIILGPGG